MLEFVILIKTIVKKTYCAFSWLIKKTDIEGSCRGLL